MNFHELDKFQEWASKVEEAIDKKPSKIKDSSKRLIYWARRIEEIDSVYYNDKIQEYEYRLVSKAIQIIFDQQYKTYLVSSKKHGQYTKARQKKVGRFAYYFQALLLPLAEKIQANKFLKEKNSILHKRLSARPAF